MKVRHDPPVPPVSKTFDANANDEETRRKLPPRWPHVSGEKPPASKKTEAKRRDADADDGKVVPTVIYQPAGKGKVTLKTIPEDDGGTLDVRV